MDVLRRLRWGNVGRAAVLAGVLAFVVAWPRISGEAPEVPGAAAVPLGGERPVALVPRAPRRVVRPRRRARRGGRRAGEGRGRRDRAAVRRTLVTRRGRTARPSPVIRRTPVTRRAPLTRS